MSDFDMLLHLGESWGIPVVIGVALVRVLYTFIKNEYEALTPIARPSLPVYIFLYALMFVLWALMAIVAMSGLVVLLGFFDISLNAFKADAYILLFSNAVGMGCSYYGVMKLFGGSKYIESHSNKGQAAFGAVMLCVSVTLVYITYDTRLRLEDTIFGVSLVYQWLLGVLFWSLSMVAATWVYGAFLEWFPTKEVDKEEGKIQHS
jgi:hypothetical protein